MLLRCCCCLFHFLATIVTIIGYFDPPNSIANKADHEHQEHIIEDQELLISKLKIQINRSADSKVDEARRINPNDWRAIDEIERWRANALQSVGNLVLDISEDVADTSDPVLILATRLLADDGITEATEYIESTRQQTVDGLEQLDEQLLKHAKKKEVLEKRLIFEAKLQEFSANWDKSLAIYSTLEEFGLDSFDMQIQHGHLLCVLSRFDDAEKCFRRALESHRGIEEKAIAMNSVAVLFSSQNRLAEEEETLLKLIKECERLLEPDHREIGTALSNLAMLFAQTDRLVAAEVLMRRVVGIRECSAQKPYLAHALHNLADVYFIMGESALSENLVRESIQELGEVQNITIKDYDRQLSLLTRILIRKRRLAEARKLVLFVLPRIEDLFGPGHPRVAAHLKNLSQIDVRAGRLREASQACFHALAIYHRAYGAEHTKFAEIVKDYSYIAFQLGQHQIAEKLLRFSLSIEIANYGIEHHKVAESLSNLAAIEMTMNRLKKAEVCLEIAFKIASRVNDRWGSYSHLQLMKDGYFKILEANGNSNEMIEELIEHAVLNDGPLTQMTEDLENALGPYPKSDGLFERIQQSYETMASEEVSSTDSEESIAHFLKETLDNISVGISHDKLDVVQFILTLLGPIEPTNLPQQSTEYTNDRVVAKISALPLDRRIWPLLSEMLGLDK